tara:strand:- start:549 stop:1268 length:720 start_codon:yes stop_codon:yes gene_type:complete
MSNIIELLRSDVNYYQGIGKEYLSNSDIGTLIDNPQNFHKPIEKTQALLEGSYFHTAMLEPLKIKDIVVSELSSRTSKEYKSTYTDRVLLRKECDAIDECVQKMKSNFHFYSTIYEDGNLFEEPNVMDIGLPWKGKADIITSTHVIDLKTTSSPLKSFRNKAYMYNYDSQAWIYEQLFSKPLIFYVINKKDFTLGIFEPSGAMLASGEDKVHKAMDIYRKYYGDNPTESVKDHYVYETI